MIFHDNSDEAAAAALYNDRRLPQNMWDKGIATAACRKSILLLSMMILTNRVRCAVFSILFFLDLYSSLSIGT
jgi:hypothetical protein